MSVLRMTEEAYAARLRKAATRVETPVAVESHRKYKNRPTGGYASVKEARRAEYLKIRQQAGEISDLAEQVEYELIPKQGRERACKYVADFTYRDAGALVVEDVKGFRKGAGYKVFVIKRKLMLQRYGIAVREV